LFSTPFLLKTARAVSAVIEDLMDVWHERRQVDFHSGLPPTGMVHQGFFHMKMAFAIFIAYVCAIVGSSAVGEYHAR